MDVRWKENALSGASRVVKGDPYEIFITEPEGFRLTGFDGGSAGAARVEREGRLLRVSLNPDASGDVSWTALFENRR